MNENKKPLRYQGLLFSKNVGQVLDLPHGIDLLQRFKIRDDVGHILPGELRAKGSRHQRLAVGRVIPAGHDEGAGLDNGLEQVLPGARGLAGVVG